MLTVITGDLVRANGVQELGRATGGVQLGGHVVVFRLGAVRADFDSNRVLADTHRHNATWQGMPIDSRASNAKAAALAQHEFLQPVDGRVVTQLG
jgi:hypothetical protein